MTEQPKAVELSAVVAGHTRHNDRSLTIRLRTVLEAPVELATWLDMRKDLEITALISDDPKATVSDYKGQRDNKGFTPSQRLRNALFGQWSQMTEHGLTDLAFPEFYDTEMNKIIEKQLS